MAEIVLGIATAHSPQLSTPPEDWPVHAERDNAIRELWGVDGKTHTYEELLETNTQDMEKELTVEKFRERDATNQAGLATLGRVMKEVAPDVLIMVGDDQKEVFFEDNMPAMLVYWGETILNKPRYTDARAPRGLQLSSWAYGEEEREYPVQSDLGLHVIEHMIDHEFDVGHSNRLNEGRSMPHCFGFIYRRILDGTVIPTVPVYINTYYPPNQPTPKRCYDFGAAIRDAVASWGSDARVGIIASGGLSHFVVNEELDRTTLDAIRDRDAQTLKTLPRNQLMSGNSEIRNWIAVAGAADHLKPTALEYVPGYRTPAGTGCGMGFAYWT